MRYNARVIPEDGKLSKQNRGLFFIGTVRRYLLLPVTCRWNAWVRDLTASLEGGWLIRSTKTRGVALQ